MDQRLTDTLDTILDKLDALERQHDALLNENRILYRQVEALFALYHQFDLAAPLIGLRGWAASPDFAALLAQVIRQQAPDVVLELGSGFTSVISGYAVQQAGRGHVYALDHHAEFAEFTRRSIARHRLGEFVTVLHAPLIEHIIDDKPWQWYDLSALPAGVRIDLLMVDGPAQHDSDDEMVRYPALPLLKDRLNDGALIVMDDADRTHESQVAAAWEREFAVSLIRHYDSDQAESEKGARTYQFRRN